jgi:hypothetical protein
LKPNGLHGVLSRKIILFLTLMSTALREIGGLSDELIRIRKNVTVLWYSPRVHLSRLKESYENPQLRILVMAEIRTRHIRNVSVEHYCF